MRENQFNHFNQGIYQGAVLGYPFLFLNKLLEFIFKLETIVANFLQLVVIYSQNILIQYKSIAAKQNLIFSCYFSLPIADKSKVFTLFKFLTLISFFIICSFGCKNNNNPNDIIRKKALMCKQKQSYKHLQNICAVQYRHSRSEPTG